MRGVAIRSEPRTRVSLMKCIFEDNSSNDVGTIFNRGVMDVDNCSFKNNGGKVSRLEISVCGEIRLLVHLLTNTLHKICLLVVYIREEQ
jgi:hypothetical protein